MKADKKEVEYELIYDLKLHRPACVLIQAAYKCGARPQALRHFKPEQWLTSPTPGMRRMAATDAQWRKVAAMHAKQES